MDEERILVRLRGIGTMPTTVAECVAKLEEMEQVIRDPHDLTTYAVADVYAITAAALQEIDRRLAALEAKNDVSVSQSTNY